MTVKDIFRGIFFMIVSSLCKFQYIALWISYGTLARDMSIAEYVKASLAFLLCIAASRICYNIATGHPGFKYDSDIDDYYGEYNYIFKEKGAAQIINVIMQVICVFIWMMSFYCSLFLLDGSYTYLKEIFSSDFYVAGLYSLPSFMSFEGVWSAWYITNDIQDAAISTSQLSAGLAIFLIAAIMVGSIARFEVALPKRIAQVHEAFKKGGKKRAH